MCYVPECSEKVLEELGLLNSGQARARSLSSSLLSKYFSRSCNLATADKSFKKFLFLGDLRAAWPRAKVARKYDGVNFGRKIQACNKTFTLRESKIILHSTCQISTLLVSVYGQNTNLSKTMNFKEP